MNEKVNTALKAMNSLERADLASRLWADSNENSRKVLMSRMISLGVERVTFRFSQWVTIIKFFKITEL